MAGTRFQMRIDPWWQPLLLVGGGTQDGSYLELSDDALTVRFGWLFQRTIPRSDIEEAVPSRWPVWMGVGWRTDLRGLFGLIGSYRGVVELRLRAPIRVWGMLTCRRLAVSLEEPEQFVAALAAG